MVDIHENTLYQILNNPYGISQSQSVRDMYPLKTEIKALKTVALTKPKASTHR